GQTMPSTSHTTDVATKDIGAIDHYFHSRWRVYPQAVTSAVELKAGTPGNTFGLWKKVVPVNIVPFDFHIVGIVVETVSEATTYFIQVGYNTADAEPGANMESGERRFRLVTLPVARGTEVLEIRGQEIPANSSVWGRMKTASGTEDTAEISLVLSRHVVVSKEVPIWPAFPW
ncbi:unnamed protein product, partial [marine sediment metagenome]